MNCLSLAKQSLESAWKPFKAILRWNTIKPFLTWVFPSLPAAPLAFFAIFTTDTSAIQGPSADTAGRIIEVLRILITLLPFFLIALFIAVTAAVGVSWFSTFASMKIHQMDKAYKVKRLLIAIGTAISIFLISSINLHSVIHLFLPHTNFWSWRSWDYMLALWPLWIILISFLVFVLFSNSPPITSKASARTSIVNLAISVFLIGYLIILKIYFELG